MRRTALLIVLFGGAACSVATPSPSSSTAPKDCVAIATVRSFVAARDRPDGAAAAALFTSDGFIEGVANYNGTAAQPAAKIRYAGADRIKALVDGQLSSIRSFEITDGPQGCGAETTWTERRLFVNPLPPVDLRVKATIRDGKIASMFYTEAH